MGKCCIIKLHKAFIHNHLSLKCMILLIYILKILIVSVLIFNLIVKYLILY